MKKLLIAFLFFSSIAFAAEGNMLFLDANGNSTTSLSMRVIPGQTNTTAFRVVAEGGNISSLSFFALSQDLTIVLSPPNRTQLAEGDFQLVTVSVSVSNSTQAGFKTAQLIVMSTKPETGFLPLVVEIPSTTEWDVSDSLVNRTVASGDFGKIPIGLSNTGNIPISGHVSVVDTAQLIFIDESDFELQPDVPQIRPVYYFVRNITPGTYTANITFVDVLGNTRRTIINFMLPDITAPSVNVSLGRNEIYPDQKITASFEVSDDVNVSALRYRLDGDENTTFVEAYSSILCIQCKQDVEIPKQKAGFHTIEMIVNDTSGNNATAEFNFTVIQFQHLNMTQDVNFLTFMPEKGRSVKIGTAIQPVKLNVTLINLNLDTVLNTSINISFNGKQLAIGSPQTFEGVTGDIFLDASGLWYTPFSGSLKIDTEDSLFNPTPTINFHGKTANYTLTPSFNLTLPGISSQAACTSLEGGSLETSKIECLSSFTGDMPQEQISLIGSPQSLNIEREGYRNTIAFTERERNDARNINIAFVVLIILIVSGYLIKTRWYDQRMAR